MARKKEVKPSQTRVHRGLTPKEVHELVKGNAILQLQRDVDTLTSSLADVFGQI